MSPAQKSVLKWSCYVGCCLLLSFFKHLFLGSVTIWGAIPFLPPVLLAVVASLEEMRPAVIFGMLYGALCDLTIPAPYPCLYTLAFTLSALLVAALARSLLQPGFPRALLMTALTFALVDCGNACAILLRGADALFPMLSLYFRETLVSCLLLLPAYPLLRAVHRFFRD